VVDEHAVVETYEVAAPQHALQIVPPHAGRRQLPPGDDA
jgi:hypothetical protein